MPERRFPPPWTAGVTPNCFIVRDANGQALSYVYYENEPGDDRQPSRPPRTKREGLRRTSQSCRSCYQPPRLSPNDSKTFLNHYGTCIFYMAAEHCLKEDRGACEEI
jgi:hypothetical protein